MSQYTQPLIALPRKVRSRRAALLATVLALAAVAAVVLLLAIDGDSSSPAVPAGGKAHPVHPAQHSGGATARDGFATAVSSQSVLSTGAGGPDESRVAASIAGR